MTRQTKPYSFICLNSCFNIILSSNGTRREEKKKNRKVDVEIFQNLTTVGEVSKQNVVYISELTWEILLWSCRYGIKVCGFIFTLPLLIVDSKSSVLQLPKNVCNRNDNCSSIIIVLCFLALNEYCWKKCCWFS